MLRTLKCSNIQKYLQILELPTDIKFNIRRQFYAFPTNIRSNYNS